MFTVFKDGWHPAEVAEQNADVEWQWTKKEATLAFKNPKKDALFYLDVDNPGSVFNEPQQVQVSLGGQVVDEFTLQPKQPELRKIPLKAAQLGADDVVGAPDLGGQDLRAGGRERRAARTRASSASACSTRSSIRDKSRD